MAICGLVITLEADASRRDEAIALLRQWQALTLGTPNGARLPAVLEEDRSDRVERQIERLCEVPGVLHVDLAYAHYEIPDHDEMRGRRASG